MSKRSRDIILGRLKNALPQRAYKAQAPNGALEPRWIEPATSWESLFNKLASLSAVVGIARAKGEVQRFLEQLTKKNQVKKAILTSDPLLERADIAHLLQGMGVMVQKIPSTGPGHVEACSKADLGVTAADAIVDESGSLILRAAQGSERAPSLLPPVHMAVIDSKNRVARVRDLVGVLRKWGVESPERILPSAVYLITGPSRTADIEFTLILGAHGPKALYVLILDY